MTLKTFRAPSMADALAAVKKDLGRNAVILHTRSVRTGGLMGLGAKTVVEIIASDDVNVAQRGGRPSARPARTPQPASAPAHSAPHAPWNTPRAPRAGIAVEPKPAVAAPAAPGRPGPVTGPVEVQLNDRDPRFGSAPDAPATATTPSRAAVAAYRSAGQPPLSPPIAPQRPSDSGARLDDVPPPSMLPVRERRISRLATPASLCPQDADAAATLHSELAAIKRMVSQVLQTTGAALSTVCPRTDGMSPSPLSPGMPDALFNMYLRLLECEVSRELADSIAGAVRDELTPQELADPAIVRQTVLRRLAGLIPVADQNDAPLRPEDGRPFTVALVGPTGVGKTTTIAKLAASYKLRHGKRVGLITADTYRIAAVDQLRTYAGIIGLPLKVVLTPDEMAAAADSLSSMDVVLIDTAGRSPRCTDRLDELREMLDAARPHQTHLVLSMASDENAMLRAADAFRIASPNRVLFTKLDEAVNFGVLVNIAQRLHASLSFITTGQEVPDHIESGHPDRLARLVLDGRIEETGLLAPAGGRP